MDIIIKIISAIETIPFLGRVVDFLFGLILAFKKEVRLILNLSRPIMVIGSPKREMEIETRLLKDAGFFRIENPVNKPQNTDRLRRHSLIIVGYTSGETKIQSILATAKYKNVPVIVVASPGEISRKDIKAINSYSFCEIANSNLRLMNLIFSILSTYKYDN